MDRPWFVVLGVALIAFSEWVGCLIPGKSLLAGVMLALAVSAGVFYGIGLTIRGLGPKLTNRPPKKVVVAMFIIVTAISAGTVYLALSIQNH